MSLAAYEGVFDAVRGDPWLWPWHWSKPWPWVVMAVAMVRAIARKSGIGRGRKVFLYVGVETKNKRKYGTGESFLKSFLCIVLHSHLFNLLLPSSSTFLFTRPPV